MSDEKPRRMQANPSSMPTRHAEEHDESPLCSFGEPCHPVESAAPPEPQFEAAAASFVYHCGFSLCDREDEHSHPDSALLSKHCDWIDELVEKYAEDARIAAIVREWTEHPGNHIRRSCQAILEAAARKASEG